jgi:heptosyltransferase-3
LISASLIPAMRARFPSARLDYLGADTTAILLRNLPLDQVFTMSRSFIVRPWAYLKLLRQLRRQQYDLVIQVGGSAFSEMICMWVLKARYTLGGGKWSDGICNIKADIAAVEHAYDCPVVLARMLGTTCADKPVCIISPPEQEAALARLAGIGLAIRQKGVPFVALFMGGHKGKRWPAAWWETFLLRLQAAAPCARILILLGPEELSLGARIRALPIFKKIPVLDPFPLREFAAILQQAHLMVTPDTGPMHLAVGMNIPTIAILQSRTSLKYAPRGKQDVCLLQPTIIQVVQAVQAHPSWPGICAEHHKERCDAPAVA